ncbi:MAG: GNAT family N-acetyltransferase [Nitrososphaerota archaeon]|jgi:ribosomal-protein-alanine acetyltransferase|nr:GNAT family N-acetyltransferase [Nitrososphaerota archaeon]
MCSIKIESADLKFIDAYYQIETQCFDAEAFSKGQLVYLLTAYNVIALAAKADFDVAGFIVVQVETDDTEFGHIITLSVAQKYRCMHIATRLLEEIEFLLKRRGIAECRLEVREDNSVAIGLYQKLGYQKIGKLKRYYGNAHGLYFKKML